MSVRSPPSLPQPQANKNPTNLSPVELYIPETIYVSRGQTTDALHLAPADWVRGFSLEPSAS